MSNIEQLIDRAEGLIDKLESIVDPQPIETDWGHIAWRWQTEQGKAHLAPIELPDTISLADLHHIDRQKETIVRNTAQFVKGFTANNVLLTGARGTGKSSIVKALLNHFSDQGLRLVEVDKRNLVDLPAITKRLRARQERFIIYCDDLSFEAGDDGYKALKVVLDGSVAVTSDNILVYATSNRRNLMPELMADNLATQYAGEEVRPNDTIEEKTSLSERFGLWLTFYPFDQTAYLVIAQQWLQHLGVTAFDETTKAAALQWAQTRGARSGRVAYQFALDFAGQQQLDAAS